MPICTQRAFTEEQVEHFLEKGHVVIRNAFSREFAEEWVDFGFKRLGYDPIDSSTWEVDRIHLPVMNRVNVKEIAPGAWEAICDIMGGEERLANPDLGWGDGFIINFSMGADEPWLPPEQWENGWHKDGDFFRHFLDSPEQGLLTIIIWKDIEPMSGGTFVACDSILHVARLLQENPQGFRPGEFNFKPIIEQCTDFVEVTGEAGDVVLLHPFVLHSASRNPSGRPRFITNPPVAFKEPMNFNRDDPEDFSLVELAILRGLGLDRLDFQPIAEREKITPERVRRQQKILDEQRARLGISTGTPAAS